jgi:hypothetical protein
MEEHMPKVLVPLIGLAMISAAALLTSPVEANVSALASGIPGATSAVEHVKTKTVCVQRRVCGPHGRCAMKTVCRRAPAKSAPSTKDSDKM